MKRFVMIGAVAGLAILPAWLMAQTAPAGRGNAGTTRRSFEKFTVEGQPIDRRPPELDTDHPVFPGQTHAPYHKTTDVAVTTIASGLDNPWAVGLLPSGRFLITQDLDFSDIRKFAPGTHHGLMLMRLRVPGRRALAARITEAFRLEDFASWGRCFVLLTDHKLRVRRPPG